MIHESIELTLPPHKHRLMIQGDTQNPPNPVFTSDGSPTSANAPPRSSQAPERYGHPRI